MTIRVLLWDVPELLKDIVAQAIVLDREMELVFTTGNEADLTDVIRSHAPDVIISQTTAETLDATCAEFLHGFMLPRFIGVLPEGRDAYLFSLRPEPIPLGEISTGRLLQAIHAPARWH